MSLLSLKDFATSCNVKYGTLKAHINRNKVVKQSDNLIDTDNPINKIYYQEQQQKKKESVTVLKQTVTTPVKEEEITETQHEENDVPTGDKTNLSLRKLKAEVLKTERDAELKQIDIEKRLGKLLPIKEVESILIINVQSILSTMESEIENLALVYCDILGGGREHLAEMIVKMREALNRIIIESKQKSADEIDALVEEYAETRARGERK